MKNITLVTGVWDLNRANANPGWNRSFDHYVSNFVKLLQELSSFNLVVFVDPSLENLVWEHRQPHNTRVYHHTKDSFSGSFFPFFDKVQQIRSDPEWYNQAGWLKDSTQGSLEYYNPMVMSKMFLLHNAKVFDPFNSEYFYWIDGGITNTLSLGYFNSPIVLDNLIQISAKFLFICFPYETDSEIHGFNIEGMKKYANSNIVNRVARGGFFGGHKNYISEANNLYYSLLNSTLNEGYMGTEESIFTLMTYLDPYTYNFENINGDGLIYTFFEKLQNNSHSNKIKNKVSLYINTYNSPEQLQLLLDSFEKYAPEFLNSSTEKVLINNSTNTHLFSKYDNISAKYNLTEKRMGNLGICGSRQWAAEHFDESSSDFMVFFEDDMLIDLNGLCLFGFNKNTARLYSTLIDIMNREGYDFIKFSFSEFYGHNGDQWSWHNVPETRRNEYFGNNLSSKPSTLFHNIKSLNGIPYADGEIYYSNWPHIINKTGNKKCFLDTKWARPYEQTWMSHIYTLTKEKTIKPAILLASPITHNRVYHYHGSERKES
jgi:hypothetical protein